MSTVSIGGMSLAIESFESKNEAENIINPLDYIEMEVPNNNSFKSYMSYKAITNKKSKQYELREKATTNELGIREVDGRLCIAIGTYYSNEIGTKLDVILENGNTLKCIVGDIKDNKHTDKTRRQTLSDNSVIEFIVDTNELDSLPKRMGNISWYEGFDGEIEVIRKYINLENDKDLDIKASQIQDITTLKNAE